MKILKKKKNVCVSKDILRPLPVQFSTVRCPCPGGCVRCEALRIYPPFSYVQTTISGSYASTNHGNGVVESYTNIYRPAPLRPVPRGESSKITLRLQCYNFKISRLIVQWIFRFGSLRSFLEIVRKPQRSCDEHCVIDKCDHMDYCPLSEYSTASRAKYLRASVFPCFLFVFKRHRKCHRSFMAGVNSGFVVLLGQIKSRETSRHCPLLFSYSSRVITTS